MAATSAGEAGVDGIQRGEENAEDEVESVQDWPWPEEEEEEEDWGGYGSSPGFWEGDSFRLEQFTAEPASWYEGDVEVSQTMGTVDLIYYFPEEEAHFTQQDIAVEVAGHKTKVTLPGEQIGKKAARQEIGPLSGSLLHAVRPQFSVWRLLREGGQTYIHLHLAKLEHRAWKTLWAAGWSSESKKHRFHWQARQQPAVDPYAHPHFYTVPHEMPPPPVDSEYRLDPVALCLGMDDIEEFDEHALLRLHFNRKELERLEGVMPLEDVLTADVQERHLRVFLRVAGEAGPQQLDIFEGELHGRCVPELTSWQLVRAAKGNPKGKGEAFNPALEFTLTKHPDEQKERWGRLFGSAIHAEILAQERAQSRDKEYRRHEAQLNARLEELLGSHARETDPVPPAHHAAPAVTSGRRPAALAEPAAAGAPVERTPEPATEEAQREFLIDNSELQATTKGLGYRLSKHMQDKDGVELAEWGTTVMGVDQGDGWVKVGHRYLPTKLSGKTVLTGDVIGLPRPQAPSYV